MKSIYRKAMEHLTLPPDALAKIQMRTAGKTAWKTIRKTAKTIV